MQKKSQILKVSEENYKICGELIRKGKLVAFPTETVYGLGANALDKEACLNIYKTKGRPLTDPLIVHISKKTQIEELVYFTEKQKKLFNILSKNFWPGPLTMIFKAKPIIPKELTAGTGFIGIRLPNHKTALKFIEISKRPIAGPSANLFNHVSPTTAKHVFNDFFDKEVTILDDGKTTLGIESTVVKVMDDCLLFYRLGSLPKAKVEKLLFNEGFEDLKFVYKKNKKQEDENCVSPGQFVKHYSPKIDSFILTNNKNKENEFTIFQDDILKDCVFIDCNKSNFGIKDKFLKYFDLSEKGSLEEAMQNLYFLLREGEDTENAKFILIWDLKFCKNLIQEEMFHFDSIYDKIYRSCSGNYVTLAKNGEN